MTSDLPFDSNDTDADDRAGDTAYRVATGVARVARAGAYVTGGALVAANGGTAPSHPGSQRLDSWHTGWAAPASNDPEPDAPSPVVTFPEPDPHSIPAPPRDVGHHGFQLPSVPTTPPAPNGHAPSSGPYIRVVSPDGPSHSPSTSTWPEANNPPTWKAPSTPDGRDPAPETHAPSGPSGFQLPEWHAPNWWDAINGREDEKAEDESSNDGHGFGLPRHGLGQAGNGFGMPDSGGFAAPGDVFGLPRLPVANSTKLHAVSQEASDTVSGDVYDETPNALPRHMFDGMSNVMSGQNFDGMSGHHHFDGVGNGDLGVFLGAKAGMDVHTQSTVGVGTGTKGAYPNSDPKIEAPADLKVVTAAGSDVGDQVDHFNGWLDDSGHGMPAAGPSGRSAAEQHGSTPSASGLGGSGVGHQPVAPVVAPPALSVVPVQPIVPVPAPIAPPPPVVNVVQPVAATPLQTTIQPDAASTPIANVLAPPPGPSPLTAPAAVLPTLFDHPVQPVVVKPVIDLPTEGLVPTAVIPTIPTIPTTITPTMPTPGQVTPDLGTTKFPELDITKLPTIGIPTPSAGSGIDITKTPGFPGTQMPGTTVIPTRPSTPDNDVTLPSAGAGTTGHTAPSTHTLPSVDIPTVDVPTLQPSLPPTISHSAPAPTLIPITPSMDIDLPTAPLPTGNPWPTGQGPATIAPPFGGLDPKPHGIASELNDPMSALLSHNDASMYAMPVANDHSAFTLMAAGGLSAPLMPEAGMHEVDHLLLGGLDSVLM
ncbi:hypothetical protein ACLMAJ_25130 [Nocardia sp. KC 131]|uniref:hypothetical protein n=1 Tax=Nocardia arseniciresistens TaxID=3392119 RepID=UPI00398EA3EC